MALKPLKPCRRPGCGALTREGYCPAHSPRKTDRRESAEYHSWYSRKIWTEKLRPEQLMRQPFCCTCSAQGIRTRATVVDHKQPHRGNWALFIDPRNHQSLCKHHHDQKTAREQAEKRRENRA